jgi:chromosome segregation protein
LEAARKELQELVDSGASLEESAAEAGNLEDLRSQVDSLTMQISDIESRKAALESERIRFTSRADALDETLAQRSKGESGSSTRIPSLGKLADFVSVADGWEEAVSAALGNAIDASVIERSEDFVSVADEFADQKSRNISLLALRGGEQISATAGKGKDGVIPAISVVSARENANAQKIMGSLSVLLASVGLAEDLSSAMGAIDSGRYRMIVTKTAQVLTPVSFHSGAHGMPSDLSLRARKEKALKDAEQKQGEIAVLEKSLGELESVLAQARNELEKSQESVDQQWQKISQNKQQVQILRSQVERDEKRAAELRNSQEQLIAQKRDEENKLSEFEAALESAKQSVDENVNVEDLEKRAAGLQASLDQARSAEIKGQLEISNSEGQIASLGRQASMLHQNAVDAKAKAEKIASFAAKREQALKEYDKVIASIVAVQQLLVQTSKRHQSALDELIASSSRFDEDLSHLREQRGVIEPQVAALNEREHSLDVDRERLATIFGQLAGRADSEFGLEADALLSEFGPELPGPVLYESGNPVPLDSADDVGDVDDSDNASAYQSEPFDRERLEKSLKKAQSDLVRLGKVNPLATEEYESLQERYAYLTGQRDDIVESQKNLLELVKGLDSTMENTFKAAFDDISVQFEKIFSELFPGGKGKLRLEDENDLLGTGILIEASPAGKRVKQLSLLSGGEKSLTVLAFLLAIFIARPSPFYVLDEVEAALDDLNLTRLLTAFKELRERAQLIIITHQQRTMGIADALYGVTMRADGITAVISQKINTD